MVLPQDFEYRRKVPINFKPLYLSDIYQTVRPFVGPFVRAFADSYLPDYRSRSFGQHFAYRSAQQFGSAFRPSYYHFRKYRIPGRTGFGRTKNYYPLRRKKYFYRRKRRY